MAWNSVLDSAFGPGQPTLSSRRGTSSAQSIGLVAADGRRMNSARRLWASAIRLTHGVSCAAEPVRWRTKPSRLHSGCSRPRWRSARIRAWRAKASSALAQAWPVENSQSSSCSASGLVSQRSRSSALRACATLLSGTPSENSKSGASLGPESFRNARSICPRLGWEAAFCVTTSSRAAGLAASRSLHHWAQADPSDCSSAA